MERIGKVSDRVAYLILVSLCDDDSTIRYKAEQQLDKFDAPSAGDGAIVKTEGTKRKADSDSDLMVCVDCKGVFSEQTRRGRSVCRFHNDLLVPDYDSDFWADHDEDCHGTIDTDEMRAEFPEGFIWECCERANGSEGCRKRNHHVPLEATRKRAKLGKAAASATSTASVPIEINSDDNGDESDDNSDDRTNGENSSEEDLSE